MRDTNLPVARQLSEMSLIHDDLANSLTTISAWMQSYTSAVEIPNKAAIEDSLFRDSITQFVGCFDSKNAYPLVVETVYPTTTGIAEYFKWLRDLRNSYTAHRHGGARQCTVGIFIDPETFAILGHGKQTAKYRGPSVEGHAALVTVFQTAIEYTAKEISILENKFLLAAEAIPLEQRPLLPFSGVQGQAPQDMQRSRGRIQVAIQRETELPTS